MPPPLSRRAFVGAAVALARCSRAESILDLPAPKGGARIAYGSDPNQFGELRVPARKGPHPVILFIHGGFWQAAYGLTYAGHLCAALTQAGFATWSLEYRRIGQQGGGWPGTQDDVRRGAEHLSKLHERYDLDRRRVMAAGHSAGGQLALWLAAQAAVRSVVDLRGVVGLAAVSDLRRAWSLKLGGGAAAEYLGGTPREVPARYSSSSPIELLPIGVPQRVLHGTADDVVPFEMSGSFARASKNARLVAMEGTGHFDLIDPRSSAWPVVRKNLTEWG